MCVCVCVDMCMWVPVSWETSDLKSPGAGVRGEWEPPDVGAGNPTQFVFLTTEPSLQPHQ